MISINSTVFELELQQRNQELDRKAERRRQTDELVHFPNRSRKNLDLIRRIFRGNESSQDQIA